MKKSKLTLVFVAVVLVFSIVLSGCGGNNVNNEKNVNDESGNAAKNDGKKATIGIMLYNYTDIQGKEIKSYSSYLEKHFNVTFKYATIGTSEEEHITGLENLLASGVDGVISGYDTALEESVRLAEDAGVYYAVALGEADENVKSDFFVGGVKQFGENAAEIGAAYAEQAHEKGVKNIAITSFPAFAFLDAPAIISGFNAKMGELDDTVTVYDPEYHSFLPQNAVDAVTKIMSGHREVDAIFALGSGMDFVYPAVLDSTKPDVKVLALGYNDSTEAALENGTVLMAGTNNYSQSIADVFAQLYDRINGHKYTDWKPNGSINYVTMKSAEDVSDFKAYVIPADKSKGSVTAEELKQEMLTFNEQATWEGLQKLTSRTVSEIKQARQ
ncbi:sugar ABC transporter substrate-binding protein [Cohnella cholangitidis]|uniref:Sugar ABC transporter substrate-binding protein n=1 Tax=Cohnella cholangitidis TaxID=2598458 RepID=A0A7G5C481_9BACL|nr:sugar ABC transporter substrate-binding protein [Cohnella cholangitidis]QMV44015.1 sugar ABC transporter substrate-binding protein [Cohnella cholangitidis]